MDFPYGTIVEVPDDFVPPDLWPEYGEIADPPGICVREALGPAPKDGSRWGVWPIFLELFTGDAEPDLRKAAQVGSLNYNRVAIWHRLRRKDKPKGWFALSAKPYQIDGVIDLSTNDPYTNRWSKKARGDLRRWQALAQHYTIERVSLDAYSDAYKRSRIAKKLGLERLHRVHRRFAMGLEEHIELWGVRNAQKELVAGTGIVFSPTHLASTHLSPFVTDEGARVCAATALTDHWLGETKRRGYTYAVTTDFWFSGQPKSWKGFSKFKSHFGFMYVQLPPALFRFVRGKVF